ncbi:Dephospho-CoA kinase CAB5 [Nakaseomyces bracarensis]|uniref:Dephospho-CoA kinase CAB5 n=1 Tax=Nakaseomyces bracarensis TaxID=273131 RepID=A0ABR4P0K4_9SACH
MLIVGLTGGIACGKSTVSRRLKQHYEYPVIDADEIARVIVEPGEIAYESIVEYFGEKIPDLVNSDGSLNRPALGRWVFANKEDLKMLNSITHPAIRQMIFKNILYYYLKGYKLCVLDVPLLFESHMDDICAVTISVVSSKETQLERLLARNPEMSEQDALNRIKAQMSMEDRIGRSDYVIQNNGTLSELYGQLDNLVKAIEPTFLRTVIEYFPPFAFISAAAVYLSRRWRASNSKK